MDKQTKVIILGSGTPNPTPDRSGPCVALVVGDNAYLVDFGTGVVRQAAKAREMGIPALRPKNLRCAFLTHLHSDHTLGYADLILTPWVLERQETLKVFGPKGTNAMTDCLLKAYEVDIKGRRDGLEKANRRGCEVVCTEIEEGRVYKDELVEVVAFSVKHPPFEAYGYKFITPDRVVVVSGDTSPCDNLIDHARGCDLLIHEVYSSKGLMKRDGKWRKYHSTVHTSSVELGEIAGKVNPGELVMYHQLFMAAKDEAGGKDATLARTEEMIADVRVHYEGPVHSANDLDIY